MVTDLEQMWAAFDTIYAAFDAEGWSRRYGKHWTFADQPFHMAYFDREVVNRPIEAGLELPEAERWSFGTIRGMNEWNASEFAKRPSDETPQRSLERMREEHDRQRTLLSKFGDADMDTVPVYFPALGAVMTLRDAVVGAIVHNWGELSELRYRADRTDVEVPASATKTATSFYVVFMSMVAKPERAVKPFSLTVDLTGPGGGTYTIRLAEGKVALSDGGTRSADLTMRTTPDNFNLVMIRQISNPMIAMLTGKVKIKGLSKMGRMRKLFPEPGPDDAFAVPG